MSDHGKEFIMAANWGIDKLLHGLARELSQIFTFFWPSSALNQHRVKCRSNILKISRESLRFRSGFPSALLRVVISVLLKWKYGEP